MAEHPITPPPELVQQWRNLPEYTSQLRMMSSVTLTTEKLQDIATQAARWGADQQLAKDAEWLDYNTLNEPHLRITPMGKSLKEAMRPKSPSLKEQALAALNVIEDKMLGPTTEEKLIRKALEQLDD